MARRLRGFVPANKDDACPSIGKDAYPCCEEKRMVADLQRVKAINPNASTVMYFNMVLDFPQYELHHQMLANPHWALALPNGSRCQMSGDSGPATKNPDPEGRPGTLGSRYGLGRVPSPCRTDAPLPNGLGHGGGA